MTTEMTPERESYRNEWREKIKQRFIDGILKRLDLEYTQPEMAGDDDD